MDIKKSEFGNLDIMGIQLVDIVRYPNLFGNNLETRMICWYMVLEAMISKKSQVLKRARCFPRIIEYPRRN